MQFTKNIAFTTLIKAAGHFHEFNFRRKHIAGNSVYDIDVSDERGNRHYFSVQKTEGLWTIREQEVGAWIREASPRFHEAIEEQEQKG